MRLDRLITLGFVDPSRRILNRLSDVTFRVPQEDVRLPILMYHSVSEDLQADVSPYYRTVTTSRRFTEHMRFLNAGGWRAVNLRDGLHALNQSPTQVRAQRLVALTFDDGFRDFLTAAAPILQLLGFSATIFLPTAFIADNGICRKFLGRDCLTWSDVRQLHRAGFEFGSHTVNHAKLVDLSWPEIEFELTSSKADIAERIGVEATSFAYPYAFPQAAGAFVLRFREILRNAGYRACVATSIGRVARLDDPYCLKRLPINDADDLSLFAAKLYGAYDWLGLPQRVFKAVGRGVSRTQSHH